MRKFIFVVMIIFVTTLFSQGMYAGGFGIKGGLNFAKISNLQDEELDWLGIEFGAKTGAMFGMFYRFDVGKSFAIQPEVYYSRKGTQASGQIVYLGIPITYDVAIKIDYLEIPVLFKYKIRSKGKFLPALFAGPYIAFKTLGEGSATIKALGLEESEDLELEGLKSTDFGLTFGGSLGYDIGHSSIIIDIRYSLGLSKLSTYEDDPDMKNSAFSILLGYAFD